MTTRHRLNRSGHPQADAALSRAVIVRLQHHEPTEAYTAPRIAKGKTNRDGIRCLKRLLARGIWAHMRPLRQTEQPLQLAA